MLCSIALWVSYTITSLVLIHLIDVGMNRGFGKLLKTIANFFLLLPGSESLVKIFTRKEVKGFLNQTIADYNEDKSKVVPIPPKAIPIEELRNQLELFKKGDEQLSENGRLFAYVYTNEGPRFQLQKEAFRMFTRITSGNVNPDHADVVKAYLENFMHDNALNPLVFPNLRKFENEVVAMTANMLNGDSNVVGSVTSGGTESILMAMKTYREQARYLSPKITNPNVVAPMTIHPAFEKAACYFNLTVKHVPVDPVTFNCNLEAYKREINENTILLLASAPSYPQGIMDQVEEISKIAVKHRLPLHVDACFGGFMLPWVEKLGKNKIKKWDFRLPGVTSISADLHKYGFATKGASVVCYRNSEIRKHQFYCYSGWSGGLYVSPTMAGSRPGGHLAAAWVALRSMGQDGYIEMAEKLMETTEKMMNKINSIDGLCILGNPLMSAFAFATTEKSMSVFSIVDVMEKKGLTNPTNITFESCNLNSVMRWSSPMNVRTSDELPDRYGNEFVLYSVFYWEEVDQDSNMGWLPFPNCSLIQQNYCELNIELSPFLSYEFAVTAQTNTTPANSISEDNIKEFIMYIDGFLCTPNFSLKIVDDRATINITTPPRVTWSGELLTDVLGWEDLQWEIEYWNVTSNNYNDRMTLVKPAYLIVMNISMQGSRGICVRLKFTSISFDSKGWSHVVCKNKTMPAQVTASDKRIHRSITLKTIFGCIGLVFFIGLLLGLFKLTRRFVIYIKGKDNKVIPQSLNTVMTKSLGKTIADQYSEVEKVTLFNGQKKESNNKSSNLLQMLENQLNLSSISLKHADAYNFQLEENKKPLVVQIDNDSNLECSDYVMSVSTPDSGNFSFALNNSGAT